VGFLKTTGEVFGVRFYSTTLLATDAIRGPEWQARQASHCSSKQ